MAKINHVGEGILSVNLYRMYHLHLLIYTDLESIIYDCPISLEISMLHTPPYGTS